MSAKKKKLRIRAGINLDHLADGAIVDQLKRGGMAGNLPALHKWNNQNASAYCIPNELICGELGRFIGLPIPPFGITHVASCTRFQMGMSFR